TEAMRLAVQRQPKSGDNGIRAMSRAGASAGIVMSVCCTLGGRPIRDTGEIGRARLRVQFSQQSVIARVLLLFSYKAGGIVDVTENDCAGRASLLARRHQLAVADRPVLDAGSDAGCTDPLDAICALLHDAAPSNRDLRIENIVRRREWKPGIIEPVETAHLVGTVVGAGPCADASAVGHLVEALARMHRCIHRADELARRFFAVHAGHRLKIGLRAIWMT